MFLQWYPLEVFFHQIHLTPFMTIVYNCLPGFLYVITFYLRSLTIVWWAMLLISHFLYIHFSLHSSWVTIPLWGKFSWLWMDIYEWFDYIRMQWQQRISYHMCCWERFRFSSWCMGACYLLSNPTWWVNKNRLIGVSLNNPKYFGI